jgi:hypothetical protein
VSVTAPRLDRRDDCRLSLAAAAIPILRKKRAARRQLILGLGRIKRLPMLMSARYRSDCVAKLDEERRSDNNRIGTNTLLNQYCALPPDLESMLLAWARKIVLQHNRSQSGH